MQFIKNIYLYRPLWGHCYLGLPRDWSNSQNIGLVRVRESCKRTRIFPIYSQLPVVNTNYIKFALAGIAAGKE